MDRIRKKRMPFRFLFIQKRLVLQPKATFLVRSLGAHFFIKGEREMELRRQYPKLEGGVFFSIDCIENYELIRELSSFGKDLLVLSPADIQQKERDRVAAQFQAYQLL